VFKLTIRSIWAHKVRFVFTGVAIILGVGFMAGTFVLTDTVQKSFDDLFTGSLQHTDAVVRGEEPFEGEFGENQRERIPETLIADVAAVDGVAEVAAGIEFTAQIIGSDGKPIGGGGPPTFGSNWSEVRDLNPFCIVDPEPRQGECNDTVVPSGNQVVIDAKSAEDGGLAPGSTTQVITATGPIEVEIIGVANFGFGDAAVASPGGATMVLFDMETAQALAGAPGEIDTVSATADSGVSQNELRDRIATALRGEPVEVITGQQLVDETKDTIGQLLSFITTPLLFFAGVSIFVGTFVVYNVFNIVVAQRTREMALLRAIGASRSSVLRSVLGESIAVGLVASVLGFGFGVLVASALRTILGGAGLSVSSASLVIAPRTMVVSVLVGLIVTIICGTVPALRASRTPPVAAMSAAALERTSTKLTVGRLATGFVVTGLGVLLLLLGLFGGGDAAIVGVAAGAVLIFIGVFVLGPLIARPVASLFGRQPVGAFVMIVGALLIVVGPIYAAMDPSGGRIALAIVAVIGGLVLIPAGRSAFGIAGQVGRENAMRNPKRTSAASAALMIGVALVGLITIFAASLEAEVDATISRSIRADFIVANANSFSFGGFDPAVGDAVAMRTGTDPDDVFISSTALRLGQVKVNDLDTAQFLGALDPATFADPESPEALFDFGLERGSLDLGPTDLAIGANQADDLGVDVGDTITLGFARTGAQEFTVTGVFSEVALSGYVISLDAYEQNYTEQSDFQVYAKTRPGVSPDEARDVLTAIIEPYPTLKVQNQAEYRDEQKSQISSIVNLIYVLLAFAVVIAGIGIAITLALSVFERTREIGLLRAVGMTRIQLRSSVRWEAVLIALLGTALGLAIAVFFGWALIRALESEGFSTFVVPPVAMLIVVLVAVVLGVVTAVYPAWRAARLNVLQAIAHE